MPRYVDHDERRGEIINATIDVLSDSGLGGLSFRSLAGRLGGSTTVVTHYYPTIKDLLDDVARRLVQSWESELEALEKGLDDPYDRLWALLTWLLPLTERGRREERSRIALLADQLAGNEHRAQFEANERQVREFLRGHLAELVEGPAVLERSVELLRVTVNGIVLAACEQPGKWPRKRQLRVVELALAGLGIVSGSRSAA
jgi:AcrR family transcriptional regulator